MKSLLNICVVLLFTSLTASSQIDWHVDGMPPAGNPQPFTPPNVQEDILPNGLRVWYCRVNDLPLVEMNLVVHAGSAQDDSGKAGLAFLTADMMVTGTKASSAKSMAEKLAVLGSSISSNANYDYTQIFARSLLQNVPQTLTVLSEIVTSPSFDTTAFKKKHQGLLDFLYKGLSNHATFTTQTLLAEMYGYDSPYPYTVRGRFRDVFEIKVDDCRQFYSKWYTPSNMTLLISGNIDYAGFRQLLVDRIGKWNVESAPNIQARKPRHPEARIILIDNVELKQALIRIGYKSTDRNSPDFEKINLMNEVFGGSRSSILARSFWGQRSLSPNFVSGVSFHKSDGYCVISGSVPSKYVDSALGIIDAAIAQIKDSLVSPDELWEAKKQYTDNFDKEFSTHSKAMMKMLELSVYQLNRDYNNGYVARFNRVTREDIRDVANILFSSPQIIVVAGDAEMLEPILKARYSIPVTAIGRAELMQLEAPPGLREWEEQPTTP